MTRVEHTLPAPKQARSEASTGRLLDAAAELIAEGGYERMTLAAIGKRAGYSHGLVTARFGSKEGLLWTLVERMVVDWREQVLEPTVGTESGISALHTMLDELEASWRRAPNRMTTLYILMFEALLPVPLLRQRMAELHQDLRQNLCEFVERAISDGAVRDDVDTAAVARLVLGGIRGAVYQAMLDPEQISIATVFTDLRALVDSLLPTP